MCPADGTSTGTSLATSFCVNWARRVREYVHCLLLCPSSLFSASCFVSGNGFESGLQNSCTQNLHDRESKSLFDTFQRLLQLKYFGDNFWHMIEFLPQLFWLQRRNLLSEKGTACHYHQEHFAKNGSHESFRCDQ